MPRVFSVETIKRQLSGRLAVRFTLTRHSPHTDPHTLSIDLTMTTNYGELRISVPRTPCLPTHLLAFKNTFLTQLMTINVRSREFPNALTRMLASQESVNNAMALKGEDAVTLVDILDQVGVSMRIRAPHSTVTHRLSRHRECPLISEEEVSAFFGEFVACRQSSRVLAYSQKTSRRRETSNSLPGGSQMCGKVVTVGTPYA